MQSWLDGLAKTCMHSLSFSGIVHQGGRSRAACGPVAREMEGVGGLLVYITQNAGRSTCLPIMLVSFWCPGMSSNDVTIRFASMPARSLPLMGVCPLLLCSIMGSPSLIMYRSVETMVAMNGL